MRNYLLNDLVPAIDETVNNLSYTQEALSERLANAGRLPMFGFPTRVRTLYTFWPRRAYHWPPERGTIERDLDVAISQFAPGSQTVKDKAVQTSVGVVDFKRFGNIITPIDGFSPPLSQPNPYPIGLCTNCQSVVPRPALLALPPGGEEPSMEICPVCKSSPPSMRTLDVREPQGFFTDLSPEDFDCQFEWQPRSTRPSLSIGGSCGVSPTTVGNCSLCTSTDHILSINDDGGKGGFDFQKTKIGPNDAPGAYSVSPGKATLSNDHWVTPYGSASRIALVSRRMTDVLLVNIVNWPAGIFADPTTVEGRAAWYSFAFWLRTAAAVHLDVDALELQAGFRSLSGTAKPVIGEAFLCDQLENGAGYCQYLGQGAEFQQLMRQGDFTDLNSIAAKWVDPNSVPGSSKPHGLECDTSCNLCLRDFHNLPYHGLLDWRLALDMVQIAMSSSTVIDLTSSRGPTANYWALLTSGGNAPIPAIMNRLFYGGPVPFGNLRGYIHRHPRRKVIRIERHPLWQDDHSEWLTAKADAEAQYSDYTVLPMNPFIALRKPAEYA